MTKFATGFIDGTCDITYNFVDKEFLIESFPQLMNQGRIPTLWMWGRNSYGQVGDGVRNARSSPVQTISNGNNWKQISGSGGSQTISGIKEDGTLWIWGEGTSGRIGDNSSVNRSSPVQTAGSATTWCLASGSAGLKTDGTLWVWGDNTGGLLGDGTTVCRSSPVQTSTGGTNWKSLCEGGAPASRTIGGIKTDGTLWLWGNNPRGILGNSTTVSASCPVQVSGGGGTWKMLSIGLASAAVKTDGTLWTWGCNDFGVLGDGTTVPKSSPAQVSGAATTWRVVSSGFTAMAAIKTDGTLWTWGCNGKGLLGTNTTTSASTPVQTISGGSNWRRVNITLGGAFAATHPSAAAIKSDGTLWTWGVNTYGTLGDNTTVNKSSPVQTVTGGSNWRCLISGGYGVLGAIRDLDAI